MNVLVIAITQLHMTLSKLESAQKEQIQLGVAGDVHLSLIIPSVPARKMVMTTIPNSCNTAR